MTSSRLETHRQTILHFLNEGVCNAQEIHKLTNIPLSTIKYNIKKLKETGTLAHRKGNEKKEGHTNRSKDSRSIYSKKSYCKTF